MKGKDAAARQAEEAALPQPEEGARLAGWSRALLGWYDTHRRALPWRLDAAPYRVWVSEIMLQQTRIEAVLPYFDRFMAALPTVADLAACREETLLKLWEGLGYYSRARNLQKAARILMEEYGGELPADADALLALPGIGEYTAGAIASISFGLPVPAVDGNVLRVLARLTASRADILRPAVKRRFTAIAAAMLPAGQPGAFNQALMELGERICLPNSEPRCGECPLAPACRAREQGIARELPVRTPKKPRRIEVRTIFVCISREIKISRDMAPRVLLHRRAADGLLGGLWELPGVQGRLIEGEASAWAEELGLTADQIELLPESRHIFSHVEWHMQGYRLSVKPAAVPRGYVWATGEELARLYALPSAFRAYTACLPEWLSGE